MVSVVVLLLRLVDSVFDVASAGSIVFAEQDLLAGLVVTLLRSLSIPFFAPL